MKLSKTYSFRISNPQNNVMYDDLLGPDLVGELSVFPAQERTEGVARVLVVQTSNELATPAAILEILKRHGLQAELMTPTK
jgi:hypothetical protein